MNISSVSQFVFFFFFDAHISMIWRFQYLIRHGIYINLCQSNFNPFWAECCCDIKCFYRLSLSFILFHIFRFQFSTHFSITKCTPCIVIFYLSFVTYEFDDILFSSFVKHSRFYFDSTRFIVKYFPIFVIVFTSSDFDCIHHFIFYCYIVLSITILLIMTST